MQEDESVRRASGVASTSAREAVGLDACLQVCAPLCKSGNRTMYSMPGCDVEAYC